MSRTIQHTRETVSRDQVRTKIDSFYRNGDALVRDWTERDYGVDYVLELFDNGNPTGKLAFLQIKGTEHIEPLVRSPEVSCKVSVSSLYYAKQTRIPLMLIYQDITRNVFYYIDINSIETVLSASIRNESQKEVTVHIPIANLVEDDLTHFFELINSYY